MIHTYPRQNTEITRNIISGIERAETVICQVYQYKLDGGKTAFSVNKPYGKLYTEYNHAERDGVTYITDFSASGNVTNRFYAWIE